MSIMSRIINWVKQNKLTSLLVLILAYLLLKNNLSLLQSRQSYYSPAKTMLSETGGESLSNLRSQSDIYLKSEAAPAPEVKDRMVAKESTMSLLVKSVVSSQKLINDKVKQAEGYMVTSYVSHPEENEAASGYISVRVPQTRLDEILEYFRRLAVRVVSENLSGQDVTDEYVDIDARLATLLKTKLKFEEILNKTDKVTEILEVQRELVNLQSQIDSLKGQQNYLEKSAQMSKVTVYLSTDELALPYAPAEVWRPSVIFKRAVRSLVGSLRKIGTALIWIGVYSIVWLPIVLMYIVLKRRSGKTKSS